MYRHARQSCRAPSDQAAAERQAPAATSASEEADAGLHHQVVTLAARVTELAALLLTKPPAPPAPPAIKLENVVHGTQNVQINITPWDGGSRLRLGADELAAEYESGGRLKEYAGLATSSLVDPAQAPAYVADIFMNLVRRAHEDPAARNVYLNPRRADQTLVHMRDGTWRVLPLTDASHLLLDGVAETIHRCVLTDAECLRLPREAQNALSVAGMLYREDPEEYARRTQAPMTAHLENVAPAAAPRAPPRRRPAGRGPAEPAAPRPAEPAAPRPAEPAAPAS